MTDWPEHDEDDEVCIVCPLISEMPQPGNPAALVRYCEVCMAPVWFAPTSVVFQKRYPQAKRYCLPCALTKADTQESNEVRPMPDADLTNTDYTDLVAAVERAMRRSTN